MYPQCENCREGVCCPAPCLEVAIFHEDMRRYLYRNVACEYRKSLRDFHQMPNVPGWS
jgi:hypothetical protein